MAEMRRGIRPLIAKQIRRTKFTIFSLLVDHGPQSPSFFFSAEETCTSVAEASRCRRQ
jgi:hypothetical protein